MNSLLNFFLLYFAHRMKRSNEKFSDIRSALKLILERPLFKKWAKRKRKNSFLTSFFFEACRKATMGTHVWVLSAARCFEFKNFFDFFSLLHFSPPKKKHLLGLIIFICSYTHSRRAEKHVIASYIDKILSSPWSLLRLSSCLSSYYLKQVSHLKIFLATTEINF